MIIPSRNYHTRKEMKRRFAGLLLASVLLSACGQANTGNAETIETTVDSETQTEMDGEGNTAEETVNDSDEASQEDATSAATAPSNNARAGVLSLLKESHTNWSFTNEAVKEEDIASILEIALNTPSAMNAKPWQFNVITDTALIQELANTEGSKSAPLMIIVSVENENEMKILDAGLVTEAMSVAAQILGYSTKIETAPARTIRNDTSGHYAELLEIPSSKSARAALFIGYSEEEDGVSSATVTENTADYVKYYTGE